MCVKWGGGGGGCELGGGRNLINTRESTSYDTRLSKN